MSPDSPAAPPGRRSSGPPASEARAEAGSWLLGICFALSGLAALVYQTAWTRQFAFVFGTSDLAVATVLASYMGGLALGAAVAARWAGRVRRPVLTYGLLELGIAVSAVIAVPLGLRLSRALYVRVFAAGAPAPAEAGDLGAALFYAACSFAIVLVPTGLMGATLPLLARHVVRSERDIGSRVGALYALNTAGAVGGALLAGFVLLPRLGLGQTIGVAAGLNAVVFGAAVALARVTKSRPEPVATPRSGPGARALPAIAAHWILPLVLASGAVSFAYEVLWTRLLGHVLGGSVTAFATMLASFLTGIALGSAVAARLATDRRRSLVGFGVCQLGIAACALGAFAAIERLAGTGGAAGSAASSLLADATVAGAVLLPSTLCIGATFPFAVRVFARDAADAARASARVYSWNTLGAIAGSVGTGFWLLPALGFEGVLAAAAAANLTLALGTGLLGGAARAPLVAAAAIGLVGLAWIRPAPPWTVLRSAPLGGPTAVGQPVHYGVGRRASVLLLEHAGQFELRSDGLPEATILPPGGRAASFRTAGWLGALPTLLRPGARSLVAVGLGGGVTLENVPSPIGSIEVVELEPEVVRANRAVSGRRARDPLADPRVRVVVDDGRSALQLRQAPVDAVVSQPSHPWTSGASHLYSREFFELVRSRLSPGGVLVQWMGLRFVDEDLLRTLLATLAEVFPYVQVYRPAPGGILMAASDLPLDPAATAARAIAADPERYASLGVFGAEDVLAALALDTEGVRAVSAQAPVSTDDRNLLWMRGGAIVRSGRAPFDPDDVFAGFDPLLAPLEGVDRALLVRRLAARGFRARARRVAEATPAPAEREAAEGNAAFASGRRGPALRHWQRALELDPGSAEAWWGLRLARRDPGGPAPTPDDARLAAALDRAAAALASDDWAELARLDDALSFAGPAHPAFAAASRPRIAWRLEGPDADAQSAREALLLADAVVAETRAPADLVVRARAAARAGWEQGALTSLGEAMRRMAVTPAGRSAAQQALVVLDEIEAGSPADRDLLRRQLVLLAR